MDRVGPRRPEHSGADSAHRDHPDEGRGRAHERCRTRGAREGAPWRQHDPGRRQADGVQLDAERPLVPAE